jgi:serine/threonine-protein kinase
MLEGLAALHARGLVHRDVKAENLLLDREGRGLLGDFGSARFEVDLDVAATGLGGSLATVAPEVLRRRAPTPASDVYATGALLYRLLTGEHYVALDGADAFEARERILLDSPRLPHPRVPASLEAVLRRALAKAPGERPTDAATMRDALSEVLEHEQRAPDAHDVA